MKLKSRLRLQLFVTVALFINIQMEFQQRLVEWKFRNEGPLPQAIIIHRFREALFRITLCKQTIEAATRKDHHPLSNTWRSQNLRIKSKVTFLVSFKVLSQEGVGRKILEIIKDRMVIPSIGTQTNAALLIVHQTLTMAKMTQTSQQVIMNWWIQSRLEERPMSLSKSTVNS